MRKILQCVVAFFLCVALFRALNNAGPISLYDLLVEVQSFEFDLSAFYDHIAILADGDFKNSVVSFPYYDPNGVFVPLLDFLRALLDPILQVFNFCCELLEAIAYYFKEFLLLGKFLLELLLDLLGFSA